jgi:hypothetical protein
MSTIELLDILELDYELATIVLIAKACSKCCLGVVIKD